MMQKSLVKKKKKKQSAYERCVSRFHANTRSIDGDYAVEKFVGQTHDMAWHSKHELAAYHISRQITSVLCSENFGVLKWKCSMPKVCWVCDVHLSMGFGLQVSGANTNWDYWDAVLISPPPSHQLMFVCLCPVCPNERACACIEKERKTIVLGNGRTMTRSGWVSLRINTYTYIVMQSIRLCWRRQRNFPRMNTFSMGGVWRARLGRCRIA